MVGEFIIKDTTFDLTGMIKKLNQSGADDPLKQYFQGGGKRLHVQVIDLTSTGNVAISKNNHRGRFI